MAYTPYQTCQLKTQILCWCAFHKEPVSKLVRNALLFRSGGCDFGQYFRTNNYIALFTPCWDISHTLVHHVIFFSHPCSLLFRHNMYIFFCFMQKIGSRISKDNSGVAHMSFHNRRIIRTNCEFIVVSEIYCSQEWGCHVQTRKNTTWYSDFTSFLTVNCADFC